MGNAPRWSGLGELTMVETAEELHHVDGKGERLGKIEGENVYNLFISLKSRRAA